MKNNASVIYNLFLVVGDFLSLILAFVGAYLLRGRLSSAPVAYPIHSKEYLLVFLSILPFWIIIFGLLGLYKHQIYERRYNELGRLLMGSFMGLLFVIFWNFVSVNPIFPAKLVPIYGFILAFVLLVIFRNLARFTRTKLFAYKVGLNHVLIVGNTAMTHELVESLHDSSRSGYKIVAVVGGQKASSDNQRVRLFPSFQEALAHEHVPIHTIIQTELYADESQNREILEFAQTEHIAYRFVPGNTELFVGNIEVELFRNSLPVIAVHQTALIGWGRIVKRLFDILVGGILLVIASPFMVLIAIAELLSGSHSVFFRQARLTRFNYEFRVFKFRSQYKRYDGTTPEEAFERMGKPELTRQYRENGDFLVDDPRITPLGRFLRRTSLDELPQLFNVVKGDVSLVGPRPLIRQELSVYEKRHTILSVKSGLTGLAQVSGRKNISFEERRKLDLYYVQNWTFWLDLIILIKTIRVILEGS
ncbi:MAG TPA: sugar transferase [Candidatus Saccharimonadales bacterium]|nr:sugar transferase [Candidatus Saccharimonadales bacterium]